MTREIENFIIKETIGKARMTVGGKILCECGREVPNLLAKCDCEGDLDESNN